MAHEITRTDGLVLTAERAWHGLGKVVESAPTPAEGLKLAGLDWEVEQWPLSATNGTERRAVTTHVENVRSDTHESLGVVGEGFTPVQNAKLAEIASALAEGGDVVRLESAGSIRGGRRVWFLLRGQSFSVRKSDEISPYILLANGHDGGMALRAIPTSVRVVCSNTLHLSLGRGQRAGFTFRHTSGIELKAEEIKSALGLYGRALNSTTGAITALAAKDVKREDVQAFFLEAYTRDFGAIPSNPSTDAEKTARERATDAFLAFTARFDREAAVAGTTVWNTFNAYTGWLQHDRPIRVADSRKSEARTGYRLLGEDADRTSAAFDQALAMA